jgi:hypothetical protein
VRHTSKPGRFGSGDLIYPGRFADPLGFVHIDGTLETRNGTEDKYLSVTGLRRIAEVVPEVRLTDVGALEIAEERLALAEAELERANALAADLKGKLDRINGTAKDGFKVVRQMGRPPTKAKVGA